MATGIALAAAAHAAPVIALSGVAGPCAGAAPSWLSSGPPVRGGRDLLSGCIGPASNEDEALVSVASSRDYAQLVAVTGAAVGSVQVAVSGALGGELAAALAGESSGRRLFVLGPYGRATVTIDRPSWQPQTQTITIAPARGAPSALAGRAWSFLSAARAGGSLPGRLSSCLAASLARGPSASGAPPGALAQMRGCVRGAGSSAVDAGLGALARALISERAFSHAVTLELREPMSVPMRLSIPVSPPGPVNPSIRIVLPALGAVLDGMRTVGRLSASGGVAPYRFYIRREAGAPAVPSWVTLTPDGMLTIAPPLGADANVTLMVYAVDATGAFSQSPP
jgi:hypothetical protein